MTGVALGGCLLHVPTLSVTLLSGIRCNPIMNMSEY